MKAWRARPVFRKGLTISILAAISVVTPAARASGSAGITFGYGNSPGVIAEAQSFESATASASPTGFLSTSTSSATDGSEAYVTTSTYAPTEAPEQDAFSVGYYLNVPNPCIRRKIGGNYCERSAPAPNAPDAPNRPRGPQAPAPPSPEEIARIAIDRAIAMAPSPQLEVTPGRIGLTGLESYFWLAEAPEPITASAGVPGLTVVARAVPAQFVWDFGDGDDLIASHAGSPSRDGEGGISHLYETKGVYDLSVDVIWEASYSVNGGSWTSIGFFSTSDARSYPVREIVAVLTD